MPMAVMPMAVMPVAVMPVAVVPMMHVTVMQQAVVMMAVMMAAMATMTAMGTGAAREQAQSQDEGQKDREPLHGHLPFR